MSTFSVKCKWPGGTQALTFDLACSGTEFRILVESLTGIPAEYQKSMCAAMCYYILLLCWEGSDNNTDAPQVWASVADPTPEMSNSTASAPPSDEVSSTSKMKEESALKEERSQDQRRGPSEEELEGFESQADFGQIVRRVMPDDNSCLFHTMAYVLENQKFATQETLQRLRQLASKAIQNDPVTFDQATLGKSNADYAHWLLQPNSWGGAIELSIFSKSYGTEIYALDVTNGLGSCFGEDEGFNKRVYVIFDGIHYDAIALSPVIDEMELDITEFKPWDQPVEQKALDFLKKEKAAGHYTDTQSFQILCLQCQQVLKGEKGAATHAMSTGHSQFVEKTR